jgi:hypothetical protein
VIAGIDLKLLKPAGNGTPERQTTEIKRMLTRLLQKLTADR